MRVKKSAQAALKIIFIFAALCAAACAEKDSREIIDRSGRMVTIDRPLNRIVSSAPSNTEIIVDLGLAGKLIAIDKYSGNIPGIPAGLPVIDFSYPDAEALLALEPDIIIANGHNVTVSGDDPFRLLKEMGIPVAYITMSKSIEDIYKDIEFIADLLRARDKGDELIRSMKTRVDDLAGKTSQKQIKRSVYFEISAAPDMITFGKDSYINDMIAIIGAKNIFENDNWVLSPSAESIIERNPDVIITCVDYLDDPIGELKNRYGFNHINAVINNRIYRVNMDSVVRPSARIVLALEQMSRAVYPEVYE